MRKLLAVSKACCRPAILRRGAIASLLVGTAVILVNQGPAITEGDLPSAWQVVFTYAVPFVVASTSSCLAPRQGE